MKTLQQYTIQELLKKNSQSTDLQNINWDKNVEDVEWDVSCILGGDWEYNKQELTIKRIS